MFNNHLEIVNEKEGDGEVGKKIMQSHYEEKRENVGRQNWSLYRGSVIVNCFGISKPRDFILKRAVKMYGKWKKEESLRAARMEVHLNEKWALDALIEELLSRFDAHYRFSLGSRMLPKDVAQILMPTCRLPMEMIPLAWYGNWRPSCILVLLQSLNWATLDKDNKHRLSQVIRETRIEEAVLDEEMAEIQAHCILHLPFGASPTMTSFFAGTAVYNKGCLHNEFIKIYKVITRANKLRFKTLEVVVKKLLKPPQAAKFLVAFTGILDTLHHVAASKKQ